jgi:D-alanyl-D-alanine carboxypeptidase
LTLSEEPDLIPDPGGGRIRDKTPPPEDEIVEVEGYARPPVPLHRRAAEAWAALVEAARADGIEYPLLLPVSGYRSVEEQEWLWRGALEKYRDPDEACNWVARPGTSAHQTGRAIDCHLGFPIESEYVDELRDTTAWRWLVANADRFGFYPYETEPWHWEYNPPSGG